MIVIGSCFRRCSVCRSRQERRSDRGDAMVVWCLLLAVMLLPLGGLSVDLWHGLAVQRQLQSAAEDAAAAGASGIDTAAYRQTGCILLDPAAAEALARTNLTSQGGLGPLADAGVEVSPNHTQISVSLTEAVRLTLLSWVEGDKPLMVSASASSRPAGSVTKEGCP